MEFKIGDKVKLTEAGEEHFAHDKRFLKGTVATIKDVWSNNYACEFDFKCTGWLHNCNGVCKPFQGRFLDKHEIELAYVFEPANIMELL